MPARPRPGRVLSAVAVAALLLAASTGCEDTGSSPAEASASGSRAPSPSPSPPPPPSPTASASAAVSPAGAPSASTAAAQPTRAPAPPPAPTRLRASVETRGGALALVRGGAAQEFTVTLRNGNSAAYGHLLVAFQMELLEGVPGDAQGAAPEAAFVLERFDAASGTWRAAALRIANDRAPESLHPDGTPLAREAVRVERYRLRASAGGPAGSTPLMVYFVDTDADRAAAAQVSLPHTTR
ncbi:hypothetical protein [Streptomyces sp. NPDC091268]|uniref:hypothetical protein n=1 Tax=Streptomyces sp. NPDC091268 TaxID=3365979 RepID=UPI00380C23C2